MGSDRLMDAPSELRRRIRQHGPVTFAEFMRVALYWPRGGYYTTHEAAGPRGDFYTAPLTHPVFGALIARQLEQMRQLMGSPEPFWVLEPGAGSGLLGRDILRHGVAVGLPVGASLKYVAVDVRAGAPDPAVYRLRSDRLPFSGVRGVILANELLDAMPVHRVTVVEGTLRELYVGLGRDGRFEERAGTPSTPALAKRLASLGVRLSEGYRAEINLGLESWLAEAAHALEAGYVVIIDYGHEAGAYYDESRRRGTLRCYAGHTVNMDPYRDVGMQDIGAHVELTSVRRAAKEAGLAELGSVSQADFLRALGFDAYREDVERRAGLSATVRAANLHGMDALVDPQGMGSFRVLAFGKGVPGELDGFAGRAPKGMRVTAPLLSGEHIALRGPAVEPAMPTWEELLR